MTNPSNKFVTTDLTLATFLLVKGNVAEKVSQGERPNGYPVGGWEFDNSEKLKELILDFKAGRGTVEPKEFHDCLNKCREEMFDFLGIGKRTKK